MLFEQTFLKRKEWSNFHRKLSKQVIDVKRYLKNHLM